MQESDRNSKVQRNSQRPGIVRPLLLSVTVIGLSLLASLSSSGDPELAVDSVRPSSQWADERRCAECHEQAETFWETGHAATLRRASDPSSLAMLEQLGAAGEPPIEIAVEEGVPYAIRRFDDIERRVELDWCFGSGIHAQTWTSTLEDTHGATDLLEFRWTWFRSLDRFDLTPGQSPQVDPQSIVALGLQFDGPKAERCFSCHASVVPAEAGAIDEQQIHPGVTCQRCHGPRGEHVASDGTFHDPAWQPVDRLDAVMRCAVCHRMPEERDPHEIRPGNPDIVRFQPMGLLQSECFLQSEMTCTTCHDPHRTLEAQDATGIWQCVQCHDPTHDDHTLCAAGMSDDCLRCHMPAIEMEFPVSFTDHWIRVREPSGAVE